MSRYIEKAAEDSKPLKEPKDPKREMKKPGKYTSEDLKSSKDRPFRGGGSWRQA